MADDTQTSTQTPPAPPPPPRDPLDHDGDGVKGGFRGGAAHRVWAVTPGDGIHQVAAGEIPAIEAAGGRRATERDLAIAGLDQDEPSED